MKKILYTILILFAFVPVFATSAFGGGGFGPAQTFHTVTTDTEYIIQEIDESGNIVFMQHILFNDSGSIIDVTVSSYQSAQYQQIDEVCKTQKLFTNHILVIPFSTINTSDIGRYIMLPALAEFDEPDTKEKTEIFFDKQSLVLGDGSDGGFTTSVDFSCDDVYVTLNPRYEHAFDDSLGMDDDFSQPTVQRNAQQQGGQQGAQQGAPQGAQQGAQQGGGPQSGSTLTQQEQETLQYAEQLLREYQMAAELQNAPVNPTERPFLVEQNTEQFRDDIRQQMQIQEQLMQLLQQNPDFQTLDEQLSNEGLIQQPPNFDVTDDQISVSVPYENDDNEASITAQFQNGQISNVSLERPDAELETSLLWIIPLIIGVIAVAVLLSKRQSKTKSKSSTKIPVVISNGNYTINYTDLTREMLSEAKNLYDEELFKDAHEKLSQAIRFYYSNRHYNGTEMTNMDTLQLLRKQNIPEFDTILNYLNMCEMIEFAKNSTQRKNFFSAIEKFSQMID